MGWFANWMNDREIRRQKRLNEQKFNDQEKWYSGKSYGKRDIRSALDAMSDFKYKTYLDQYKDKGCTFDEADIKAREKTSKEMAKVKLKDLKGIASRDTSETNISTDVSNDVSWERGERRFKKRHTRTKKKGLVLWPEKRQKKKKKRNIKW